MQRLPDSAGNGQAVRSASPPSTGLSSALTFPSYCTTAIPVRFTRTQNAGYRHLNTNAPEDRSAPPERSTRPTSRSGLEYDCNTCLSTRAPSCDH
ncbi:hypothetical protein DPMN_043536 [Dreissena polymorpha]|uniref:Uncharacterized protein n=1 Tax=Dreissena polymorpha TaxID=45954 RepID=A0A9D3Y8G5_DREPO|nr:hypothetical protein DPMN_081636 [Dreissena polymorpha]KAH3736960.1 hypothetical protein DPMN_043536 [Dreissena polymorpha]